MLNWMRHYQTGTKVSLSLELVFSSVESQGMSPGMKTGKLFKELDEVLRICRTPQRNVVVLRTTGML